MQLRCTLMGFERYYQVKIPSNKNHNNKNFSTLTSKNNSKILPITSFAFVLICSQIRIQTKWTFALIFIQIRIKPEAQKQGKQMM